MYTCMKRKEKCPDQSTIRNHSVNTVRGTATRNANANANANTKQSKRGWNRWNRIAPKLRLPSWDSVSIFIRVAGDLHTYVYVKNVIYIHTCTCTDTDTYVYIYIYIHIHTYAYTRLPFPTAPHRTVSYHTIPSPAQPTPACTACTAAYSIQRTAYSL